MSFNFQDHYLSNIRIPIINYNAELEINKSKKSIPKTHCDCASCRDDICEMLIGMSYHTPPQKNIENHHCCECKCKYCVCEKQRKKKKYMAFPIIPNTQNNCYWECEVCSKGVSSREANTSKIPIQNSPLYPYLLASNEEKFTDKNGKLDTKALCIYVNSLNI